MTLSGALDFGLAAGLIVVFFVFQYPGFMHDFKWWGTEVFKEVSCTHSSFPRHVELTLSGM